jgi:ComEC/Rec2-related protein
VSSALLAPARLSAAFLQRFRDQGSGIAAAQCADVATNALVCLATAWLLGLLCAAGVPAGAWQTASALAAMSVAVLIAVWAWVGLEHARSRRVPGATLDKIAALCAVAFVSGLSIGPRALPPSAVVPSGVVRFEAIVEDSQAGQDQSARSILRVLHGARLEDGASMPAGCYLAAFPIALPNGARVRVLAKVAPRAPFRNPTPHPSPPPQFELQGEAFIPDAAAVQVLEAPSFAAWLSAVRSRVRARLIATLPARSAGIARALVLGDANAVDAADQADIRGAGLLHVLAVSGLHVAVLSGLFVLLLQRALLWCTPLAARVEVRRIACALGVPAALLYAAFAGGAPSAWRAAVTAALAWSLVAAGRRPEPAATTAFAAMLLGAIDPREVTRPAFLLSIVATAAILAAGVGDGADRVVVLRQRAGRRPVGKRGAASVRVAAVGAGLGATRIAVHADPVQRSDGCDVYARERRVPECVRRVRAARADPSLAAAGRLPGLGAGCGSRGAVARARPASVGDDRARCRRVHRLARVAAAPRRATARSLAHDVS